MLLTERERIEWIDILKGIGILAVVWGHSGSSIAKYLYWFHMPLFFLISGFLYNHTKAQSTSARSYTLQKAKHLLLPYFFYLTSIALMQITATLISTHHLQMKVSFLTLLLGGRGLSGIYGVFWFITTLFAVQITYFFLDKTKTPVRITFILSSYLAAHIESHYWPLIYIPWNLDISLYAITFYAIGDLLRRSKLLRKSYFNAWFTLLPIVIIFAFIVLYSKGILAFHLDLKSHEYNHLLTDFIVPLSIILILITCSMVLQRYRIFSYIFAYIGRASMVIMYLHIFMAFFVAEFLHINPLIFFITGVGLSLLFYEFVSRIKALNFLAN